MHAQHVRERVAHRRELAVFLVQGHPTPAFGMAVGKGERATFAMADGGQVLPFVGHGEHGEIAVVDAVDTFIHEDEGVDRRGAADLAELCVIGILRVQHGGQVAAHPALDGIVAHEFAAGAGALVDAGVGVVGIQEAVLEGEEVGRAGRGGDVADAFVDPGRRAVIHGIAHQRVVVVAGIHRPAKGELLQIVEATGGVSLLLGRRQRRQEHGGQNGDDGDDHQQLDQREPIPPGKGGGTRGAPDGIQNGHEPNESL